MTRSNVGFWPKLIRADEQIAAIDAEVRLYAQTAPHEIVGDFAADRCSYTAKVVVRERPPYRLSLMVGEFIYTLHSALDQLVDHLVRVSENEPTDQTYFPLMLTPNTAPKRGLAPRPNPAGGVSEELRAVLHVLQPYQHGEGATRHPLAILKHLSRTDKHRTLLITDSFVVAPFVVMELNGSLFHAMHAGTAKDETEIAYFSFDERIPDGVEPKMHMNGAFPGHVTFDEPAPPGRGEIVPTLAKVLAFVREAISMCDQTARGFPPGPEFFEDLLVPQPAHRVSPCQGAPSLDNEGTSTMT